MRNVIESMKEGFKLLKNIKFDSTNHHLGYLFRYYELDFDIYLEKYDTNLQRPFVWNLEQSQAFIQSLVLGRYIPPFIVCYGNLDEDKKLYVIDGKQRLVSIMKYLNNEYPVTFGSYGSFYFKDLNKDEKLRITHKSPVFKTAYPMSGDDWKLTDDEFIELFKFFNFGGTPQDKNHINMLVDLAK